MLDPFCKSRLCGRSIHPSNHPTPSVAIPVYTKANQADILHLSYDKLGRKTYKYAFTVVDVASRYNEAEPLTTETSEAEASLS